MNYTRSAAALLVQKLDGRKKKVATFGANPSYQNAKTLKHTNLQFKSVKTTTHGSVQNQNLKAIAQQALDVVTMMIMSGLAHLFRRKT